MPHHGLGVNLTQPLNFFNTVKWDKKTRCRKVRQKNNISYEKKNRD
jgi:hypothetical protein